VNKEWLWNYYDNKLRNLRNPFQCHFVHHKSNMDWHGIDLQPLLSGTWHYLLLHNKDLYAFLSILEVNESVQPALSIITTKQEHGATPYLL
jgi:hypothetical protein